MPGIVLEIPQEVTDALRLPPPEREQELRTELALALYQRGILSGGMARKLAGVTRWEFEHLLGQRHIVRHYSEHDLTEDLKYAKGG
ncbi:MAG: UPF0175 family protein [Thermoguttaceae bacterium]|jgi:predicted HTH domain antitoxin|nr:UPF0175 family protein [Thermoguttaceae bacterium]